METQPPVDPVFTPEAIAVRHLVDDMDDLMPGNHTQNSNTNHRPSCGIGE